jgi:hypothetical protein
MKRKQRHLFWLFFSLLCLLTVAGAALLTYWRHTVPLSQTSEVYRRYRDFPGVDAAFIRQMPINDTLRVDMTLLQARDSLAFANLLRDIGKSEEFIRDMATLKALYEKMGKDDIRFSGDCPKDQPGSKSDPDPANNEAVSFFPVRLIVAVFHTHSEMELNTVFYKSVYCEINIDDHK